MKDHLTLLHGCSLFYGIAEKELLPLLNSYNCTTKTFAQNEVILWAGSKLTAVGIVSSGKLQAEKTHPNGSRSLFTVLHPADVFGDILAGSQNQSPVTLTASTPTEIIFLPHDDLLNPRGKHTLSHGIVLHNFITTISNKYFAQNRRLELVTMPTMQEKVAMYLLDECTRQNSTQITLPFNREQLAVHLNCERSALSRTLSRMKKSGLISYTKNRFTVIDRDGLAISQN